MSLLFGGGSAVRRKIFVSYHHGGDQAYYDAFSTRFHDNFEAVTNNSLDRTIDSENVDYVMRRIREKYITGTSCTIVLVGAASWGRKYIDWEIQATLEMGHGLLGIRLPSARLGDLGKVIVPDRLHDNVEAGYAVWTDWTTLTSSVESCRALIERANGADRRLIDNRRSRRLRNA